MAIDKVLVVGGTGLLGRPVVEQLVKEGTAVRVMVRRPECARECLPSEVEVYGGDVTDEPSLRHAMAGCDAVHVSVGGPVDQVGAENVAALSPDLGIERLTYLSGSTVVQENAWFPMVEQKLAAEEAIRRTETPHTIFCPTWPMEQLPRFVIGGRATVIGGQPTPLHWFAAEDLARMVTTSYRTEEAVNRRFYVHGPEGLTMREALERYCSVVHPDIAVGMMPFPEAKAMAEATGSRLMSYMAALMGYFDQAGELGDPSEANELLGAPTMTLRDWIEARHLVRR